jgi:hypothetical protein
MYKEYRNRRPRGFCNSTDPFYLAVVTNKENPRNDDQWLLRGPVGKNKINNILKNMVKIAKLPEHETKRLTNSSVRKHLCQKLMDTNVPDEPCYAYHRTQKSRFTEQIQDIKRKQKERNITNIVNHY